MHDHNSDTGHHPAQLAGELSRYCQPRDWRAVWELSITGLPFLGCWLAALIGFAYGHWLFALFSIPAAVFLVRLFMIQHDCGHGSFFRHRVANDAVGRIIGVLTWTPYAYWRRLHAGHHATSGDLDMRGKGDIDTLTVSEYLSLPTWRRMVYRLYRNPFVLFGLGPAYVFLLKQRMPVELVRDIKDGWVSVMTTNLAIAALVVGALMLAGPAGFLAVQVPTVICAATIGVWLFYVQHQFRDTRWDAHTEWDFHCQAVEASSFYDLPAPLRWLTANIGIHHIHHLRSRIPSYRLHECLKDFPELRKVNRLTLLESFKCASLALWDDAERKTAFIPRDPLEQF